MAAVIDFHSHFFSRTFFETLARLSPLEGAPEERLARVIGTTGLELPAADHGEHLARWLQEMDRYGVGHLVSFASVPEEVPVLAEVARRSAGRLTPFGIVNPLGPEAPERVEAMLGELGYRGILLFPAMHRFDVAGPEAKAVLDVLDEHAATAVVHCGVLKVALRDRFGLPRDYDVRLADPLRVGRAADAHPDSFFVVPHFGGGFLREVLMAGSMAENLYVDTSSSNAWLATQPAALGLVDVFQRCLEVFGAERILFGTDSSVFPRGWRQDILTAQREALGACGTSHSDRGRIFGGNAAELLGFDA